VDLLTSLQIGGDRPGRLLAAVVLILGRSPQNTCVQDCTFGPGALRRQFDKIPVQLGAELAGVGQQAVSGTIQGCRELVSRFLPLQQVRAPFAFDSLHLLALLVHEVGVANARVGRRSLAGQRAGSRAAAIVALEGHRTVASRHARRRRLLHAAKFYGFLVTLAAVIGRQ